MNIFMTGSRGLIGTALASRLQAAGHSLTRLVRKPSNSPNERYWDSQAARHDPRLLDGCDVLVHLAGESIASSRWTEQQKKRIYDSRIVSTRALSETMLHMEQPPRAFIVASAIGYYGDVGETLLTEQSPPGKNFLAHVCRDWEQAADPVRDNIRVVHVRTGMVLSEQGGGLAAMLLPFKLGIGGVVGNGKQYWSWIALTDIARLFQFAVETERMAGPVNGTAPHPVTCREFTKRLGKRLHRPTFFPLPAFAARLTLGEMADELILASTRAVPEAAQAAGFQFEFPDLRPALDALPL